MRHFVSAALAIATLTLSQGRAAADDCLCLGSDLLFEPVDLVETTDAYVDEGEALPEPGPVTDTAALEARDARPTPVMWCLSSDDPRCSRDDDSGEAPYLRILSTPPVMLISMPRVPRAPVVRIRFDHVLSQGADGISERLDRPPRA